MKISINWMLDHIATSIATVDVGLIAAKFNLHTAEIEHYEKSDLDILNLFVVRVVSIEQTTISVFCQELNLSISLPFRNDLQVGQLAFIRRSGDLLSWEALSTYSATKEGLFPAIDCHVSLIAGGWRDHCESSDYILDVDNKSINHRPDLWGHRGIAREVAAFMGWQLKPLEHMLAQVEQRAYSTQFIADKDASVSLEIQDTSLCSRLAAWYCNDVTHKASQIWMAMRLARVDSKPINTIVDITNYVMFDISQPMHVFDAAKFPTKTVQVRAAQLDEKLELLDGHMVHLTPADIIVTDGKHPVALAGVMGGKQASFNHQATAIIIEAGAFHPSRVRNSAARVKVTSEASTRFSKSLDPMQNTIALLRFIFIAQALCVIGKGESAIISVGKIIEPLLLTVSHAFISKRLGVDIQSAQIVALLEKLECAVRVKHLDHDTIYEVQVPTLRITKDITIPEDIVEEIARLYGFENISYQRPVRAMKSFDMHPVMTLRKIKEHCAFAMNMREVRDYLFYDESFLQRLNWYPTDAIAIKNPVSENWKVLVTSLIPHLIKNVELNMHSHEKINFFEHNSVWKEISKTESLEHKSLAGIFFGQKNLNFYDYKAQLERLFSSLRLPVVWQKPSTQLEPWFDQLQSVDIVLQGNIIGRAGMLAAPFVRSVIKGQGFVFELNMHLILGYKPLTQRFTPWSKYQSASLDISMLIDATISSESLEQLILQVDEKIDQVILLDFFEKDEWVGKRSLTFRYRISDYQQNLTKELIEEISHKVTEIMLLKGVEIRA